MKKNFIDLIKESFYFSDVEKEYSLLQLGEHLHEIKLTEVEVKLFKDGLQEGIVDSEKTEFGLENIIRSEILEWLISLPSEYHYLFRKNKLMIRNAHIIRMEQYLAYKSNGYSKEFIDDTAIYVLNLANKKVEIDLFFTNCKFYGGISISKAILQSLEFTACKFGLGITEKDFFTNTEIYASVYADQAVLKGDLVFKGQENDDVLKEIGSSDCKGDLIFTNCVIENQIKIHCFLTKHCIDFSFSSFEQINIWRLGIFNSILKLLYCVNKNVYIQGSFFLAPKSDDEENNSIAIDCSGMFSEYLYIRNRNVIIGTSVLENISIKELVNFRTSIFVSPKKAGLISGGQQSSVFDIAIRLINASASTLLLSDSLISIGILNCENIKVRRVDLSRSRFLNYTNDKFDKSIIFRGAQVDSSISFHTRSVEKFGQHLFFNEIYNELKTSFLSETNNAKDEKKRVEETFKYIFEDSKLLDKVTEIEGKAALETDCIYGKLSQDRYQHVQRKNTPTLKMVDTSADDFLKSFRERYSLIIGEADFSGAYINSKLDFAGGFFYGKEHKSDAIENSNALNLKYLKIDGDLFLNDCNSLLIPSFKAYGKVDLHSAKVAQFFITPKCGIDKDTQWRIIGLKYEYIYSNGGEEGKKQLERCNWFEDYTDEENFRQPYEQLAKAFYKAGDDTRAKRVLIRERTKVGRNVFEKYIFYIFNFFILPVWISFLCLLMVWFLGALVFEYLYVNDGFVKVDDPFSNATFFSSIAFSFKNMFPLSFTDNVFVPTSTLATNHVVLFHKVLSTLLLTSFIIGIARITKNEAE